MTNRIHKLWQLLYDSNVQHVGLDPNYYSFVCLLLLLFSKFILSFFTLFINYYFLWQNWFLSEFDWIFRYYYCENSSAKINIWVLSYIFNKLLVNTQHSLIFRMHNRIELSSSSRVENPILTTQHRLEKDRVPNTEY